MNTKGRRARRVPDCGSCRFFVPYVDGAGHRIYAECHRFPPQVNSDPAAFAPKAEWPRIPIGSVEWCGEYVRAPRKKARR